MSTVFMNILLLGICVAVLQISGSLKYSCLSVSDGMDEKPARGIKNRRQKKSNDVNSCNISITHSNNLVKLYIINNITKTAQI